MKPQCRYSLIIILLAIMVTGRTSPLTVDEPVVLASKSSAPLDQLYPYLSYGGGRYLITWQQGRNYYQGPKASVFAALLNESGRLLHGPLVLSVEQDSQEQPRVAYSDGRFLVVWQDFRNGSDWDVYGARVTSEGKILDPGGFLIAGGPHNQALPTIAPDGQGFLVVWQDFADGHFYRLHAVSIAKNRALSEAHPIPYVGTPQPQLWGYSPGWGYARQPLHLDEKPHHVLTGGNPALTATDFGWLLFWNDESNWAPGPAGTKRGRFARLQRTDRRIVATHIQKAPTAMFSGARGRFAVENQAISLYAVWSIVGRGMRFGVAALLDPEKAKALPNPNEKIVTRGSGWDDDRMLPLFFPPLTVNPPIAIAYGHHLFLAVARGSVDGRKSVANRLYGMRLDENGIWLDGPDSWLVLHKAENTLSHPALAAGEQGFLLAFQQENDAGQQQIWAKLLRVR